MSVFFVFAWVVATKVTPKKQEKQKGELIPDDLLATTLI